MYRTEYHTAILQRAMCMSLGYGDIYDHLCEYASQTC